LQHRYSLFDYVQYLQYTREPASEVGASGPYISIERKGVGTVTPYFVVEYRQYYWDFSGFFAIEGDYSTAGYVLGSFEMTVYRPSSPIFRPGQRENVDLNPLSFQQSQLANHSHSQPSDDSIIVGVIQGYLRDLVVGGVASALASPIGALGASAVVAAVDAINSNSNNRENSDINEGTEFDFYAICRTLALSRSVAVFSDDAIGVRYRVYQTEQTAEKLDELDLTHDDVLRILACRHESYDLVQELGKSVEEVIE